MWGIIFMLMSGASVYQAQDFLQPAPTKTCLKRRFLLKRGRAKKSIETDYWSSLRPVLYQDQAVELSPEIIHLVHDSANFILQKHFNPAVALHQVIKDPVLRGYGIKNILSLGVSDFSGSSRARLHNIKTALKKFDGIVVPQGEVFSFNRVLESVEAEEGFLKEKVVIGGKGSYALGGGICQLSSTIYRAALNAGLPINERRGHTYAYNKYLPYGLDATIYLGVQDLAFTNDTDGDLLIKPYIEGNKLLVAFYGTKDNRTVSTRRTSYWRPRSGGVVTQWERLISRGEVAETEEIYSHYKAIY